MQSYASRAALGFGLLAVLAACDVGSTSRDLLDPDATAGSSGAAASDAGRGGAAPSVAGSGNGGAGGAAGESPQTTISATAAAAAMGKGVNLGQMFESTQHPPTLAAASAKIDAYYAKGFRTVRIPVTWTEATNGDTLVGDPLVGDVNRAHPRLQVISQVVDYALTKPDLFVVLNAHHETGLKEQSRAGVLERLWADIADIFAARDHRLLFEILNEPHREDGSAMPAADLRDMT